MLRRIVVFLIGIAIAVSALAQNRVDTVTPQAPELAAEINF